jgi:hypothetical protein
MLDFFGPGSIKDPVYAHLATSNHSPVRSARESVNRLWRSTFQYVDPSLPDRARAAFQQCFWELYLTAILLDQNLPVVATANRRFRSKGPDIQVGDVTAWFEAIAPTAGTGQDAVPGLSFDDCREVPDDQFKLRLASALSEKLRKYQHYLKNNIVTPAEPFVIAINAAAISYATLETPMPRILGVLFPFGYEIVNLNLKTGQCEHSYFARRDHITKSNGADVRTIFFENETSRAISAVVYSFVDAVTIPSRLGADLRVIHNPLALAPLPRGFLGVGTENWRDGDILRTNRHV